MWLIEQSPYWSIVHMSHMIVRRVDTLDDLDWQNHHLDGWNGAVLCCNSSKNSPCPMNILQYHTRRVVPLHRKGINVLVFSNNQTKQIIPSHPFQQIHSLVSLESKAPSPLIFKKKTRRICPVVSQVCWVLVQDHLPWRYVEPRLAGLGGAGAVLVPPAGNRREQRIEDESRQVRCCNVMS